MEDNEVRRSVTLARRTPARSRILLLLAAGAVALGVPQPAAATFSGENGRLVVTRLFSNPSGITTTKLLAVNPRNPVEQTVVEETTIDAGGATGTLPAYPRVSPDGSRIAYTRVHVTYDEAGAIASETRYDLIVSDIDGTNRRIVAVGGLDGRAVLPFWAPDGRTVGFIAVTDGFAERDMYRVDVDSGSSPTPLLLGDDQPWLSSWSPDGDAIAFTAADDEATPRVLELPDGPVRELTRNVDADGNLLSTYRLPTYAPDGDSVWVTEQDGDGYHVARLPEDGSPGTRLTDGFLGTPSPDGTQVAFARLADRGTPEAPDLFHEIRTIAVSGDPATDQLLYGLSQAAGEGVDYLFGWQSLPAVQRVSEDAGAGAVVVSPGGTSPGDPVGVQVLTAKAGVVEIVERDVVQTTAPSGYRLGTAEVGVSAPPGNLGHPLWLTFTFAPTVLPGVDTDGDGDHDRDAAPDELVMLRNGVPVERCASATAQMAKPDPCIESVTQAPGGGPVTLVVRTTHASTWTPAAKQMLPTATADDLTVVEGSGRHDAPVTVRLSQPALRETVVRVKSTEGTALEHRDFAPLDASVTIPAGAATATVSLRVRGDGAKEPDEALEVRVVSADFAVPATDPAGQVTLLDDDGRGAR